MRLKHLAAAAIVGGATAVSAAVLTPPAFADPTDDLTQVQLDQAFTKEVRDAGLRISPKDAIALAGSTCDVLKRGGTAENALTHVKNETGWKSGDDIAKFGGLSVRAYCPGVLPK